MQAPILTPITANPTQQIYNELQRAFDTFNLRLFDNQLPRCLITLQRKANTAGYFSPKRFMATGDQQSYSHELAINPEFFAVTPILETMQTIVHEMCHEWQLEFGTPSAKTYHNKEWADKMQSIGLMPSDTGRPGGKRTGQSMCDYAIQDGLFLAVCAELFANDFRVSWYDRYMPSNTTPEAMLNQFNFVQSFNLPDHATHIPGLIIDDNQTKPSLSPDLKPSIKPSFQVKSTSKIKHQCPGCKNNLWGKPSLRVICADCNVQYKLFEEE